MSWSTSQSPNSILFPSAARALTAWSAPSVPASRPAQRFTFPYAAHRALKTGRLSALDKQPGVRQIGVASAASRLLAKCKLKVVGDDAKAACGNVNLCAGLEAGIKGALHAVRARAADGDKMEFGDWEVDHDIFLLTADEGEVQDSLPVRRAKEARAAVAVAADPPPTGGGGGGGRPPLTRGGQ